jgi:hypothetical protein
VGIIVSLREQALGLAAQLRQRDAEILRLRSELDRQKGCFEHPPVEAGRGR